MARVSSADLKELLPLGLGVHHAGLLRSDRNTVERLFAAGSVRVLVCTATLAWGVNLPAHTVVIRGTDIYDPQRGRFADVGVLDVQQIFGRAGRPQYDSSGHAVLITALDRLPHFLGTLTHRVPIESTFVQALADHLNAEIVLGTVTTIREAVLWLSYTYLHVRMAINPLAYGVTPEQAAADPGLHSFRRELIVSAARRLDKVQMARFHEQSGALAPTDLGRVASHFYISHVSMELFNERLRPGMGDAQVLALMCESHEFENVTVREDETSELDELAALHCPIEVLGGLAARPGKVSVLLQTYVSGGRIKSSSLISDQNYVVASFPRLLRGLFDTVLKRGWSQLAEKFLSFSKAVDRRLWPFQHPLRQFCGSGAGGRRGGGGGGGGSGGGGGGGGSGMLRADVVARLEDRGVTLDTLAEISIGEIGRFASSDKTARDIAKAVSHFPHVGLAAAVRPVTRSVVRIEVDVYPEFTFAERIHGSGEPWWVWIEDGENEHVYARERITIGREACREDADPLRLVFTIPMIEPLPPQYYLRAVSDRWLGAETTLAVSFRHLVLPERYPPNTELLPLRPLPITALALGTAADGGTQDPFLALYPPAMTHLNPIQTQVFHTLFHTDANVLLGAPTGSGKTLCAEMAVLRVWRAAAILNRGRMSAASGAAASKSSSAQSSTSSSSSAPSSSSTSSSSSTAAAATAATRHSVVYIAPLKALVRERMKDWRARFGGPGLRKSVVELTGDSAPDARALAGADLILTTPEKWDGVTRDWRRRRFECGRFFSRSPFFFLAHLFLMCTPPPPSSVTCARCALW
jgi:activating signal cointegrator complex subunit 3